MNEIIIRNLKIFAYHGVHEEEKQNGQNFIIDAEITTEKTAGYETDKITDTVSYSDIIRNIKKSLTETSYNLLEKAAEITTKNIFDNFEKVKSIKLTIKKPEAPIKENFDYVGIKICRNRSDVN
ncbi:MAG: dihydroneopterin aldolase [Clostridia bacterium]|nr:dihydroneopterin aldolase [Clostridia bacterium]